MQESDDLLFSILLAKLIGAPPGLKGWIMNVHVRPRRLVGTCLITALVLGGAQAVNLCFHTNVADGTRLAWIRFICINCSHGWSRFGFECSGPNRVQCE